MEKAAVFRIRLVATAIILAAVLLISRLFFIQVVKGATYSQLADRQYLTTTNPPFDRGSIFWQSKTGELISAATLKTGWLVAINPQLIKNPQTVYAALAALLPLDQETFFRKAIKVNDPYEEIANHLTQATADGIKTLNLPGVQVYKERWRYYPVESQASHLVGLMGYAGNDYVGRYGLEAEYEKVLRRSANQTFVNFFAEVFAQVGQSIVSPKAVATSTEGDLVLTIEPTVQAALEKELAEVLATRQAQSVGGVIMDPHTGEIKALAGLPAFNPNGKQTDIAVLNNPLIEDVFEMGSIVKPLTMAAAIDAGALTPQTTYFDDGYVILNTERLSNYDGRGRGLVSMQEVLNQSLNTGAVFAMQRLGRGRFRDYFLNYGLAEKTDIDLPREVGGLTKNLTSPREVEYATAAFGQGIAWTPIGITRALASLGNGGVLVRPHVVKTIRYTNQLAKTIAPVVLRRVLKPETSEAISRMLVKVVDEALVNGQAKLEHYSVAAKTGTAQIARADGGGYYNDRYLHSFFGYFPAYDPRFIIFLYVREPQGVRYASESLTKPFINLTKFLISYYEVPPDR